MFFDLISGKLLRQPRNENFPHPFVLGLIYLLEKGFLNAYVSQIVTKAFENGNLVMVDLVDYKKLENRLPVKQVMINDSDDLTVANIHKSFETIYLKKDKVEEVVYKYPLSRILPNPLFFDGTNFQKYVSDEEWVGENFS